MTKLQQLWNNCLAIIKDNIKDESQFDTWFSPIVPISYVDNKFIIQVPSLFFQQHIEKYYAGLLFRTLQRVINPEVQLLYKVIVVNRDDDKGTTTLPAENKMTPVANIISPVAQNNAVNHANFDSQLNEVMSFDNYVVGKSNKLARAAGLSIVDQLGNTPFNPLFIYGESGVGKTHIANAIGLGVKEKYANQKRVLYVSASQFQQQFSSATVNNNRNNFLMFYQSIDVLIVDDIQELCGETKEKTQKIFFEIFNHLFRLGKQIIMCSDREPNRLEGIDERLTGRFKCGLAEEIAKPDKELRAAILKHTIYRNGLSGISDEVVDFIAQHVTKIRDMQGIVTSLLARSSFSDEPISIDLARKVIGNIVTIDETPRQISMDRICDIVCEYYSIKPEELQSNSHKRTIADARKVAMYLARQHTDNSWKSIGESIGKRNHSTVISACNSVKDQMDVNSDFNRQIHELEDKINSIA